MSKWHMNFQNLNSIVSIKHFEKMWTMNQQIGRNVNILQIEKFQADAKANWRQQLKKAASQITIVDWVWAAFISAIITGGFFGLVQKVITDSWPWWGFLLIGLIVVTLLIIAFYIVRKCRNGRKPEEQESANELEKKNEANLNQ